MDRLTRTANIIKNYYQYKRSNNAATFVKSVCSFFDNIKDEELSESDLNFLLFLATKLESPSITICRASCDMLLAGPYMALPEARIDNTASFLNFARENRFHFLKFNEFEIVEKTYKTIKGQKEYIIDTVSVEALHTLYLAI